MHPFMFMILLSLAQVAQSSAVLANGPYADPANDQKHLGEPEDLLRWTPRQQIAGYRNIERIGPARRIPASDDPFELPRNERDLGDILISGEHDEEPFSLTVDQFFERKRVAGLLVLKDGEIVYERYGLGNSEASRWVSFSVSKSVVSMLIGAAIRDGYIGGVEDSVTTYLPHLKGSPYDETTIANLLQMASGVAWNEDYDDPESDVRTANWETLALYEFLAQKPRAAAPGEVFNYNTAESNLAGNLLRTAIGNNLSSYLRFKIWQPFGMEHDAWWPLTEEGGGEFGGCCLAASLRDYARIGLFALRDGQLHDGTRVLSENWLAESTTPSKAAEFYGYLWWLRDGGAFQAAGIFGQGIHIEPDENLVIALQSAREVASDPRDWALQSAMFKAISAALQ